MQIELHEIEKMVRRLEQRIEKRISDLEDSVSTKTDISEIVTDKESIESKVINIANGVKTQSIVMDKNGCITINITKEKDKDDKDIVANTDSSSREYPWTLYKGIGTRIDTKGIIIQDGKLVIK